MNSFAVVQTGGKQYRVSAGQKIKVEKLDTADGANFIFDKVLLRVNGDKVEVGVPHIVGAKVEGRVLRQARDRKKIIFKYHSKTRQRKKKGHRQPFTEIEIAGI